MPKVRAKPAWARGHLTGMGKNLLAFTIRLAAISCLTSALSFAENWSGALVDARCYDAEERNVNPTDTLMNVNRDRNQEIRYCSPGAKTKYFGVVQSDGVNLHFDAAGNGKAAELIRTIGGKARIPVEVSGELNKRTISVDSIAMAR